MPDNVDNEFFKMIELIKQRWRERQGKDKKKSKDKPAGLQSNFGKREIMELIRTSDPGMTSQLTADKIGGRTDEGALMSLRDRYGF